MKSKSPLSIVPSRSHLLVINEHVNRYGTWSHTAVMASKFAQPGVIAPMTRSALRVRWWNPDMKPWWHIADAPAAERHEKSSRRSDRRTSDAKYDRAGEMVLSENERINDSLLLSAHGAGHGDPENDWAMKVAENINFINLKWNWWIFCQVDSGGRACATGYFFVRVGAFDRVWCGGVSQCKNAEKRIEVTPMRNEALIRWLLESEMASHTLYLSRKPKRKKTYLRWCDRVERLFRPLIQLCEMWETITYSVSPKDKNGHVLLTPGNESYIAARIAMMNDQQ
jgi:hypothetical protein